MHAPKTNKKVQRKCGCSEGGSCACDGKKKVQRHARGAESRLDSIPPDVHRAVASSGAPLDRETRTLMESRFGHDFSSVRIHTNAQAVASADAVDARAYTFGSDIVFGAGTYAPSTDTGRRLLAHELAHVVQQESGAALQTSSDISSPGDAGELEADRAADAVMSGGTPQIARGTGAALQLRRMVRHCQTPNARACVIHLHPEEQNSYYAAQEIQREYCVNFVSLGVGKDRLVDVPGVGKFNANRIFSNDPDILRCHAFGGAKVSDAKVQKLINWRDTNLTPAINACTGGTGGGTDKWTATLPVVAMHNNTDESLSIDWYGTHSAGSPWKCLSDRKVAKRSAATAPSKLTAATSPIAGREDPDNFLLTTQNADAKALSPRFNVVEQDVDVGSETDRAFDASLSAAMATSRYINIEAEGKPFQAARYAFNLDMAREIMTHLSVPKRPSPSTTCDEGSAVNTGSLACQAPTESTAPATPQSTPAPPAARPRPEASPEDCPLFTSTQMLVDAKEEWRRHLDAGALDASGNVTTAATNWLLGLSAKSPLDRSPGKEAEAMRKCMFDTMEANEGKGTPPLKLEPKLMKRMHRSYESQRDSIWGRKWKFRGDPFDRITQEAIKHHTDCNALTLNGQWDPGNTAHEKCWNQLTVELQAKQIMQASSAPGISRHHYGTDFDFDELNAAPWSSGAWADEAVWLKANAKFFGFIQSFQKTPGPTEARYMPEPWHWSYWPAAQAIVEFIRDHQADIQAALVAKWSKEKTKDYGPIDAATGVPAKFVFALQNWLGFVSNVETTPPTF